MGTEIRSSLTCW
jgi:hypothetical protein